MKKNLLIIMTDELRADGADKRVETVRVFR